LGPQHATEYRRLLLGDISFVGLINKYSVFTTVFSILAAVRFRDQRQLDSMIQGICQSVTRLRCAKTAERIKVLLGMETPWDPKHCTRRGSRFPPTDSMQPSPNYFSFFTIFQPGSVAYSEACFCWVKMRPADGSTDRNVFVAYDRSTAIVSSLLTPNYVGYFAVLI